MPRCPCLSPRRENLTLRQISIDNDRCRSKLNTYVAVRSWRTEVSLSSILVMRLRQSLFRDEARASRPTQPPCRTDVLGDSTELLNVADGRGWLMRVGRSRFPGRARESFQPREQMDWAAMLEAFTKNREARGKRLLIYARTRCDSATPKYRPRMIDSREPALAPPPNLYSDEVGVG